MINDLHQWVTKFVEMEDISVGVYFKARGEIVKNLKALKGDYSHEIGENEIDEVYLDELVSAELIKLEKVGNKIKLFLGDGTRWYTDPETKDEDAMEVLRTYRQLLSDYNIDMNLNVDGKFLALAKRLKSREDWREVMEYTMKNWKWLKSDLNVSLPTITMFSSTLYWSKIIDHMKNKSKKGLTNRYQPENETEYEWREPTIS